MSERQVLCPWCLEYEFDVWELCAVQALSAFLQTLNRLANPVCWCGLPRDQHVDTKRDFRPRGSKT